MKIFAENSILKKIIIILVLLTSVWFVKPKPVQAGIGGELMQPVCDLLVSLMDGIMNVTHHVLMGQQTTLIRVNLTDSIWDKIQRIAVTAIVVFAVLAAAAILTVAGAIAIGAVLTAVGLAVPSTIVASALIANIVPIAVAGTYFGVKAYNKDAFERELDLPLYSISPERIFSNTIPFFDVNFFNPNSTPFEYEWLAESSSSSFDDKYKSVYDDSYLDFSNGQDVTTQEMKEKICKSDAVSIRNPDLIKEIKKITVGGATYYQYKYSSVGGSSANGILLESTDGKLESTRDIDFSNAEDMTSQEIEELAKLAGQNPSLISNAKKITIGGKQYIRYSIRRNSNNDI